MACGAVGLGPRPVGRARSRAARSITIKSHENVGVRGRHAREAVEPLRELFKDEVSLVGIDRRTG
jgi:GMP synthase PP-ATPase subunit